MTAIALSNLVFAYPKSSFVLSCSNLTLSRGELTLITGPNGSGKTTLSKLMCGVLKPTRGMVQIYGVDTAKLSLGEIGSRVGYLFQNPARQLFATTVWQEMIWVPELLGQNSELTCKRADELLEWFNLSALKQHSIYQLSRGEKQRLALCTMLMGGAEFFVLDEPTAGLDRENMNKLNVLLDDLLLQGKGLAIVSHEPELFSRHNARQVRLRKGVVLV
ncbi:MAG: ABC transporter ATP-binding protein [Firmicutes bacterium]|nr:ABC transporter ATP-binding protein [Bacillota bacterium]